MLLAVGRRAWASRPAAAAARCVRPCSSDTAHWPSTTVVADRETAAKVVQQLMGLRGRMFACDTEVADIDVKKQSPCGNGTVVCASIYAGPDVDFGSGPRLFVDNWGEAQGVLEVFREFFESEEHGKVWHNYGFDRHVLHNEGIDALGFAGDTMHMARLWDTSRSKFDGSSVGTGYSLEALSTCPTVFSPNQSVRERLKLKVAAHEGTAILPTAASLAAGGDEMRAKRTMKERFGRPHIKKNGEEGKLITVPDVLELHTDPKWREEWIDYSASDAEITWHLREALEARLRERPWREDQSGRVLSMYDFYTQYLVPFGELLTDLERAGICVDTKEKLPRAQQLAESERESAEAEFLGWAAQFCEEAKRINLTSDAQKQQLFFAPAQNSKTGEVMPRDRVFEVENTEGLIEEGKKKAKKKRPIVITGIGMPAVEWTSKGWPSVSTSVLRKLAGSDLDGDSPSWGVAYDFFGGASEGTRACRAIDALCRAGQIDTMLSNFILPLQQQVDDRGRVHASLNLNTETGRLSSRRPNLQNQPALEKDRYRVRDAFVAEQGNKLVVADYGQLELRLLAHMTKCKSMIDAFKSGGDFHSRTALGMYDHIRQACDKGDVLLEWDPAAGEASAPLLKDVFASERRKAKVLNFSIAYGKTAHGLAKDFGVSLDEAKDTLERWYQDRPEVRAWQERTIERCLREGYTRTLMGRYRDLPEVFNRRTRKHAERAAINTPLQGGAADVVMMAMLKLHQDAELRDLGWRMLLQIHDEVILEGPEESSARALERVVEVMEKPFEQALLVDLVVDANCADTWYEAK